MYLLLVEQGVPPICLSQKSLFVFDESCLKIRHEEIRCCIAVWGQCQIGVTKHIMVQSSVKG